MNAKKRPDRLIATTSSHASAVTTSKLRFVALVPALLTRMSMRPCFARIASAALDGLLVCDVEQDRFGAAERFEFLLRAVVGRLGAA